MLSFFPNAAFGQAPALGTAANFVLFSSVGAVGNTGISQLTGNVGTNSGAITGFGNVNGVMHMVDGASGTCAADLLSAYNQLNADVPTLFPAPLLGSGQILTPGTYSITGNATLNLNLILNALGNPNAVFIIQINGTFSTNANSKVQLINGAKACNVFWKVEGLVSMASGTTMRGTVIANNGAITMTAGDTLEGRALSTTGAVNVSGVLAYTPIGCGSPVLTGPIAPTLASTACYALFSSNGPVTNVGVTNVVGDIGTNAGGTTTGYNPLLVVGTIHSIPDGSTNVCATDLGVVYNYLNLLPYDIELLYPAQFGNNLVLTPHTYLMNAAVTFTDTLYLNAEGDANAVFVFQVNGAFGTSVNSRVVLINGAQSKNVYWEINGAVSINTNSIFRGTIICNNGAINLATGVVLDGRALTTTGALGTSAVNVTMPPGCGVPATGITTQPSNQIVCAGSSASFSVVATGSGITYQWRNGNINLVNGGSFSGVNTPTLTINPVTAADTSSFYNVVIGGSPNDTSIKVSLKVNTAPTISVQPSNQTVCSGNPASFSVVATGTGITYQWRNGTVNLVNAGNFSGVNTATLTINPANLSDTSTFYNVVISGVCPPKDTSIKVSLKINATPTITAQPSSETVCAGSSASFSVAATGTGIIYQWRNGTVNLINAGNFSGVNTATLTINPANLSDTSSFYNVVISGGCPPKDTSIKVSLKINTLPNITTQPVSQTVCTGSPVSFSVAATGTGISYQWRNGTVNLINAGNFSGVTTATLIINPANLSDTSSFYNVVISGGCAPKDTSIKVSLKLNSTPTITTQPSSETVCAGSSVSFSVATTGTGVIYQWRQGIVNLVNGGNISGATTATLVINPVSLADASSDYNVIISEPCTAGDTSINVALVVNDAPNITLQPVNEIICTGDTAIFSVVATGLNLTYQWRKGTVNLVTGGNVLDATASTLKIYPATIADTSSFYNVVITGGCAPKDTSIKVSLKINLPPSITTQPASQTVCAGSSVSFSVATTGTGIIYQWRNGTINLVNGGNFAGVNTATLVINPANLSDTSSFYNVMISGTCAPKDSSIKVSLMLIATPTITIQPTSQTVCAGSSVNFSVTTSGTGLTYQWEKGITSLINGGNISGATTATLTINPATISDTSSFYNVVIDGTCLLHDTSIKVSLKINTPPGITTQPASQTVCAGSPVSFSIAATGTGISYQWMNGTTNLINGGDYAGVNTATLIINPANSSDTSSFYNVVVNGTCLPNDTSLKVSLKINTAPGITTQPVSQTVCTGSSVSFSVATTGTGLVYQWRNGMVNLVNGGNFSGVNTATLSINPANLSDTSSFYNVMISGTCLPKDSSIKVSLQVNPLPTVTANASTTTVCAGSSVTLTGSGATSYIWTGGVIDGIVFIPLSTNTYTVTGTNGNNCSNTATITVTVNTLPVAVPSSNSPVCLGGMINLSSPTIIGATYNWAGPNSFTSTNQNPSLSPATLIEAGTYSLTVSIGICSSAASMISVTVNNCGIADTSDLSVVKTVNNAYPLIGSTVVFTIVAINHGPANATGVLVGDTLENGYSYVSSTSTMGTYNPSTGIWTIGNLNNGASAVLTVTVKVLAAGNYANTAVIQGSGIDTNAVNNISTIVTYPTDFFIPEGFSPNGDGINDLFVIRGIEYYPLNTFTIFNRWGDEVFSAKPYQSTWDGKSTKGVRVGGDDLPVGTYFYILDLGNGSSIYKGTIYLNR